MKKLLIDLKSFLIISSVFLSTALIGLLIYGKKPLNLIINHTNTPFQDVFFKYYTNVGDGLFAAFILFVLLFFLSFRNTFIGIATFLISGFISQLIKKIAYFDEFRPAKEFAPHILHYADGVVMHLYNSFPSGHSTTAFAMFMFLAYVFKKKNLQVIFAILACLVAYSRVYLCQHFFVDVICGGLFGISSFLISYSIFVSKKVKWFDYTIPSLFHKNKNS
jgi:membrane-associated phospholipid phosphatase